MNSREDRELMTQALRKLIAEHRQEFHHDHTKYESDLAKQIVWMFERRDWAYFLERRNRMRLLDLHGWKGVLVGLLIIVGGAPGYIEEQFGLISRPILGYLAAISGATLLIGMRLYRSGRPERVGLLLLGLWDLLFGLAFIQTVVTYRGQWVLCWPWQLKPIELLQPRLYAPVVYLALCGMVWGVHLRAVIRDKQGP